jgi:GNAT superfamily N-acetyltransferase
MDTITIRPANLNDRAGLCQLYHEFHEFHVRGVLGRLVSLGEPPDTYEGTKLHQALERIIIDDDGEILVAIAADQVVGLAEVYVRCDDANPLRRAQRYGHLQSLMVGEGFRLQGTGASLVSAAEEWAKAKGAVEMRVDIWEFAEGPLVFYERLGYGTLRRTMARKL